MEEIHVLGFYYLIGFIIIHVAGVFIAEVTNKIYGSLGQVQVALQFIPTWTKFKVKITVLSTETLAVIIKQKNRKK